MDTQFEAFIRERQYLGNVSPRTIQWYRESFKWLGTPPTDERTLKAFVIRMREYTLTIELLKGFRSRTTNR
ncbi:MAG TPA: hypothetical protein VMT53_24040 [Terriglobales bacterium]|nr:hypothetical protein [Terriglobales bacterium]